MNRNINGEAKIINGKQRSGSSLLKFHREFNDEDDYHQDEEKRYLDYMMMDDQELSLEALAYRLTHQDREIERLKIFQGRAVDVEHRLDRVISALEKAEDKINDLHFELSRNSSPLRCSSPLCVHYLHHRHQHDLHHQNK
jgi:hypothetical protein